MASITHSSPLTSLSSSSGLNRSASVMLYNGKSNRSRGWKSKKPGDLGVSLEGRPTRQPSLKKFDGAARSCAGWDHLKKDPAMWFRAGNCFVHLYEKGQSQRGAAFKIPFNCLLAARCQPLIEKFVDRTVSEEEAYENGHVDLYIPAPLTATRAQALQYHIATRNFFAWMFRRSVVGDYLGTTLIGLFTTMEEFREDDADNLLDLLDYLDEEGYLDMRNQPDHALAVLHLSEVFELSELYIEAFAHCVGMSDRLYKHSEYSRISVTSRKLIRRARVDMDFRLSRAGAMLGDLLHEELSEAHLGLSTSARAHLDRFRAYIHGFYATKFGCFPPASADSRCGTILRPDVYRTMLSDFEALYEYLVDTTFTPATADTTPPVAQGGLCSLQSVHEFDLRHKFTPLEHPLPLLPEPPKTKDPRRRRSLPWFIGNGSVGKTEGKLRPDQRLIVHAALMRATNHAKTHLLEKRLVLAYRQFEEDSILIQCKNEPGVSPADARKVRWLFIYAMYQTLRGCAEAPREVRFTTNVGYHLGVSTEGLPPWQAQDDDRSSSELQGQGSGGGKLRPRFPDRGRSISAVPLLSPITSPLKDAKAQSGIEIKPDIDYFALRQQQETPTSRGRNSSMSAKGGASTPRSRSQSLTRSMSFRRSLGVFRSTSQRHLNSAAASGSPSRKLSNKSRAGYHEIIVLGYGNGTNAVVDLSAERAVDTMTVLGADGEERRPQTTGAHPRLSVVTALSASRSASTSSANSYNSSASMSTSSTAVQSHASASTTPTTLVDPHSPAVLSPRQMGTSWKCADSTVSLPDLNHHPTMPHHGDEPNSSSLVDDDDDNLTHPIKRQSFRRSIRPTYSSDDMLAPATVSALPPPLPRRSSKRSAHARTPDVLDSSSPGKIWSLVDVHNTGVPESAADGDGTCRSSSRSSSSNYSDATVDLQPGPLRIRKVTPPRTPPEHDEDVDVEDDDTFRSSSDWERAVHSMLDVSPPCTWEQFTDLGGLQPIHLLSR